VPDEWFISHGDSVARIASSLGRLERQGPAEERDHMLLKPNGDVAGVCSRIDLERVRDAVMIEHVMQLAGVDA
jgi:hypothetical protein